MYLYWFAAKESDMQPRNVNNNHAEEDEGDEEARTVAQFIEHMMNNGLPKSLALRALNEEKIDPTDMDYGGYCWK
jgi:hypothetical protein